MSTNAPAGTAPDRDTKLREELIATLYRGKTTVPVVSIVSIVSAVIVALVVWDVAPHPWPALWLTAIAVVTLVRIGSWWQYQRHPAPGGATPRWARLLVVSATANGVVWGTAGIVFFTPDNAIYQVFLAFVIGGMGAGAATASSTYLPAFYAFLVPSITPLIARLMLEGESVPVAMSLLLALFGGAMALLARTLNRTIKDTLLLRLEKELLLEQRASHEQTLEQEIADRTSELRRVNEDLQAEIAERRQTEDELRETQEQIQRAINAGSVAPWEFRFDTGEIKHAPAMADILGEEIGGMRSPEEWRRRVPPEEYAALIAATEACAKGEREELDLEHRLLGGDGAERRVVTRASVIRDEAGRAVALAGTTTDVTSRRAAEQAARDSRARLEGILAAAGDVLSINQLGTIKDANPAAARMYGCAAEQLIGSSVVELVPSEDRDGLVQMLSNYTGARDAKVAGRGAREWRARRRDGSVFPVEVVVEEMKLGADLGFAVFVRDITKRKRAEEALQETEGRLSAVARTAPLVLWAVDRDGTITLREGKGLEALGPGPLCQPH